MQNLSTIGQFSLNLSFALYLIFYVPQLIHNLNKTHIQAFSLLTHFILCAATIADLIYGVSRDMPWQYRLVTMVSLVCLTLQHLQLCYFQWSNQLFWLTVGLVIALLLATIGIYSKHFSAANAITIGGFAQIGIFSFTIPQIIKNYRAKTTAGISIYFVGLCVLVNLLDSTSAWTLGWDYPSKIGSPLALLLSSFLLWQFKQYHTRQTSSLSKKLNGGC